MCDRMRTRCVLIRDDRSPLTQNIVQVGTTISIRAMAFRARGFLSFELDDQIFVERARMADSESM